MHTPDVSLDDEAIYLRAPDAQEGAITGIGGRLAMQKDDQGVRSAGTEPLQPDLYTYALSMNGGKFNDPANRLFQSSYGSAGQGTCG